VLAGRNRSTLIIWDGPDSLPVLKALSSAENRPGKVFVSSGYLGKSMWTIDDRARDFTDITYPFRLPRDEARYTKMVESFMGITNVYGNALITLKKVYSTIKVLFQVLMDMNGQYYRDNLLDVVGMSKNFVGMGGIVTEETFPLYERFSFGPGQRYALKGCYIVQLTKGPTPELVNKSGWIIH
jgi:hypothetical protein